MHQINVDHPNIDEFFPFDQKYLRYHNDKLGKGLCFGISFCLLSHLVYKQGSDILCPKISFNLTRKYMDRLKLSYSLRDDLYQYIIKKQQYEFQDNYLRSSKSINIDEQNGYGMLSMVRIDNDNSRSAHPSFHYNRHISIDNHIGVIVWDNSKLFIFDPNCGGYLCYSICGAFNKEMFPHLIDSLIDNMYRRTTRNGHSRIKYIHKPNNIRHYLTDVVIR
ncbi:hypothetical protein ACNFJN_12455 [Xenorhabdus budapestensis]|uniref:Virulence surface antigen n=1 Tax=Xenorhabdus budapestensis TaxID=290110 RepID=A0ABX7VFC5_XENBU|nr:hypothetical protein [Xenorhabdus budapestensis]QTL38532.1 hypothetical protein HGO23_11505 [Xenorhabdus budapestensis]